MPACFMTAATAFYVDDFLGLELPSLEPKPNGQTVFIWGGSSAVGSNAIQLAKASGYEVAVTASSKNFDYVKALGAHFVFDYRADNVVDDIVKALKGKTVVGAIDTISEEDTVRSSVHVLEETAGKGKVAVFVPGVDKASTANVEVVHGKWRYC